MSAGFEFLGSYTLSKALTDNLGYYGCGAAASPFWINAYDRRGDRGLSCFDAAHNFVWSGTYELPFGNRNRILGGWTISSIVTVHSGIPITIEQGGSPVSNSLQDSRGGERPDRVAGRSGKVKDPNPARWLDISAYSFHPLGVFGNAGNGSERGPGFANWDLAIRKDFAVSETSRVQFRAEFFNFTNHPSYSAPARNISDPVTFGKIFGTVSAPRNIQFAMKVAF
jgi:hypothetical protein